MHNSIKAELLLLRRRTSTWVLLGLWTFMAVLFGYVLPYITYLNGEGGSTGLPVGLLPSQLVGAVIEGFPFFGGVIVLILGAMAMGGEYGWGTMKTVYAQRPGRTRVFVAKLVALGIVLIGFVIVPMLVSALFSYGIAVREDAPVAWPGLWLAVRGIAGGWFLMAVWTAFGAVLAVLSRGTALAIGLGILYGLVVEGLLTAFAGQLSFLQPVTESFLRTNGYSLVEPLGIATEQVRDNGPGGFAGPYVGAMQALAVLIAYLTGFSLLAGTLLRKRDVA